MIDQGHCEDVRAYYDTRAEFQIYPYVEDWGTVIDKFATVIEKIVSPFVNLDSQKIIYDCTCGIGTTAIGMAQRGHDVIASDMSEKMLHTTQEFSQERRLNLRTFQHNLLNPLPEPMHGKCDVILSINNSQVFISNRETTEDLIRCFSEIKKALKPKGVFVVSLPPYEELLAEKPTRPVGRQDQYRSVGSRKVLFRQFYEWFDTKPMYRSTTKYDFIEADESCWQREESIVIRAWTITELLGVCEQVGLNVLYSKIRSSSQSHYRERWLVVSPK